MVHLKKECEKGMERADAFCRSCSSRGWRLAVPPALSDYRLAASEPTPRFSRRRLRTAWPERGYPPPSSPSSPFLPTMSGCEFN